MNLGSARTVVLGSALVIGCPSVARGGDVIISQVYGDGGQAGASLSHDFVELFNRNPNTAVNLNGWSIQVGRTGTPGNGFPWQSGPLSGSIAPNSYYLIRLSGTGAVSPSLIVVDRSFPAFNNLGNVSGKVALISGSTAPLLVTCPNVLSQGNLEDLVGYGVGVIDCAESGSSANGMSLTTSILRISDGCQDTGNNASDFIAGTPMPRRGLRPGGPPTPTCTQPPSVGPGTSTPPNSCPTEQVSFKAPVDEGYGPPALILAVTIDLSSIGGSPFQAMFDNGTNGDVTAFDGIYSFDYVLPSVPPGVYTLPLTVTDALARVGNGSITLTVASCSCRPDFNQDGNLDPDDLGDFITCYFSQCGSADYNQDNNTDPDDIADFITDFFLGC